MSENTRPSVYLQEKCDALDQVLDFFVSRNPSFAQTRDEKLVVFLSQIDVWDWEIDNLIYSFDTFADRATAWVHANGWGLANALKARGVLVRASAVKDVRAKRQARAGVRRSVVAPVRRLNEVIARWNLLLTTCEERVLVPAEERQTAVRLGAQVLADLSRYRKKPRELPEE